MADPDTDEARHLADLLDRASEPGSNTIRSLAREVDRLRAERDELRQALTDLHAALLNVDSAGDLVNHATYGESGQCFHCRRPWPCGGELLYESALAAADFLARLEADRG